MRYSKFDFYEFYEICKSVICLFDSLFFIYFFGTVVVRYFPFYDDCQIGLGEVKS